MYCVHNIMYCVNNIMGQNGTIISDFILNFQGPTVLVFTLKDSKYYSPVVWNMPSMKMETVKGLKLWHFPWWLIRNKYPKFQISSH